MTQEQEQVILTGIFGDGCLYKRPLYANANFSYHTNCIHKEYMEYKRLLLGNLVTNEVYKTPNIGTFKSKNPFKYTLTSKTNYKITEIANDSLYNNINKLNDLGIALWFMDDGSLHKTKLFYNLNTQKFDYNTHKDILEPYFKNKGIIAKTTIERKKNGKIYFYLRISKYEGADIISNIISKYMCPCFNYKVWSSETIQKWSKLQEELKSKGNLTNRQKSLLLAKL